MHNLEHGYIVLAYRCPTAEDCVTDEEMAQIQEWFNTAPDSGNPGCAKKVLAVRFDQMETRFALLAWGRALLFDDFNLDTANTFVQQWMNHDAVPEPNAC